MSYNKGRTFGSDTRYQYLYGASVYNIRNEEGTPPAPPPDNNGWIDNLNNNIITNDGDRIIFNNP